MASLKAAKKNVDNAQNAVNQMMAGNTSVTMDQVSQDVSNAMNAMNGTMMMMMGCVFLIILSVFSISIRGQQRSEQHHDVWGHEEAHVCDQERAARHERHAVLSERELRRLIFTSSSLVNKYRTCILRM
jgi:hypothetical protein